MKKKLIITGITITAFVVLAVYLLNRPKLLGSIKNSYTIQTTTTSDISFSGRAEDTIRFLFQSDIKDGDLNMTLYDSKGDAVYQLDHARSLKCFFTLKVSDTYTLAAECSEFTGKCSIKVYKTNL